MLANACVWADTHRHHIALGRGLKREVEIQVSIHCISVALCRAVRRHVDVCLQHLCGMPRQSSAYKVWRHKQPWAILAL